MGNHPIFESDFDCLTGYWKINVPILNMNRACKILTVVEQTLLVLPKRRIQFRSLDKDELSRYSLTESSSIRANAEEVNLVLDASETSSIVTFINDNIEFVKICERKLDYISFLMLLIQIDHKRPETDKTDHILERLFDAFDENLDGKISAKELQAWLLRKGKPLTLAQSFQIIDAIDIDHDQMIDFRELLLILSKKMVSILQE